MELQLFERVIQEVAPIADQVAFHLMGEPLVHPKLNDFLEICSQYSLPVFFVSNGVLLTEKRSELLLHPIIRQVNFSLHSFNDNYPGKDPSEYLERIFLFVERAFATRPDLYLNFRLWNLSAPDADRSSNDQIKEKIEQRFSVQFPKVTDVREHKSHKLLNRLYVHYDTEFKWPDPDLPSLGTKGTCYGLRNHFGILADGTVVPCCLDKEGRIPLGKIQDSPIHEILDSPKSKAILQGFLDRKLIDPLCQRCGYVTRFQ